MFTFDMSISLLKCTCEIDTFPYIFLFINFINTANVAVLVFLLNVNYLFFTMLTHSSDIWEMILACEILVLRFDHCVYDRQRGSIYTRRSFKSFKRQSVSKTNWNVQVKLKWLEARFARNHYRMKSLSNDRSIVVHRWWLQAPAAHYRHNYSNYREKIPRFNFNLITPLDEITVFLAE